MIGIVCAFFHTEGKGFYSNTATDKNYKDLLTEDDYAEALANEHFTDAGKPDENNTWTIKNIGKL